MDTEKKDILILAIESSCDETAAAVVKNGRQVLSNVISSQIDLHKLYGGVVPEIASRKHIEKINQVIEEALENAEVTLDDIDAIGVTYGPGLVGALLVGVAEAKAIAYAKKLPLVGVHHIEGHISANYIENLELEPPFLCLVVSGDIRISYASRIMELMRFLEEPEMMRQERLLIKWLEQLAWDIREDRRLISFQKRGIQMQSHFHARISKIPHMISASVA